jgi:hypothetical protein
MITVAELIAELQRQPQGRPVRVVMREVFFRDEAGETMIRVSEEEATEAVSNEGPYVLIRGK